MAEPASPAATKKGISQRTIIIIILILLLLGGGGYAAYYYLWGPRKEKRDLKKKAEEIKKKEEELKSKGDSPELPKPDEAHTPGKPSPSGNDNWPLAKGSVGDRVLYLKRAINRLLPVGYTKLTEDSVFDPPMYAALITKFGTRFYPVTDDIWMELMKKSNTLVK